MSLNTLQPLRPWCHRVTFRYPFAFEKTKSSSPALLGEAFTLTALMSACRQGRQWQKALEIFSGVDNGVAVDASLLGSAITCDSAAWAWTGNHVFCDVLRRCKTKIDQNLADLAYSCNL